MGDKICTHSRGITDAIAGLDLKAKATCMLFSDIDGTLVHYHDQLEALGTVTTSTESKTGLQYRSKASGTALDIIALPLSSTGLQAFISVETLELVQNIRGAGAMLVIISGARVSTVTSRIPMLPTADVYVMENGGRIFYNTAAGGSGLTPFTEDMAWRERHAPWTGSLSEAALDVEDRPSQLWQMYRTLRSQGWTVDANSYSTSFRVKGPNAKSPSLDLDETLWKLPTGLTYSRNLGMADVYPETSGKHMAAKYLMEKYKKPKDQTFVMCDDDNDMRLATVCSHAYLPTIACDSVRVAAESDPSRFSISSVGGIEGTHEALRNLMGYIYQMGVN